MWKSSPAPMRMNNHDTAQLRERIARAARFANKMGGPDPSGTPHPPTCGLAPLVYLNIGSAILAGQKGYSNAPDTEQRNCPAHFTAFLDKPMGCIRRGASVRRGFHIRLLHILHGEVACEEPRAGGGAAGVRPGLKAGRPPDLARQTLSSAQLSQESVAPIPQGFRWRSIR